MTREIARELLKWILHRIAHITDFYGGRVEAWWDGDDLMVGFRCSTCKSLEGIHKAKDNLSLEV